MTPGFSFPTPWAPRPISFRCTSSWWIPGTRRFIENFSFVWDRGSHVGKSQEKGGLSYSYNHYDHYNLCNAMLLLFSHIWPGGKICNSCRFWPVFETKLWRFWPFFVFPKNSRTKVEYHTPTSNSIIVESRIKTISTLPKRPLIPQKSLIIRVKVFRNNLWVNLSSHYHRLEGCQHAQSIYVL